MKGDIHHCKSDDRITEYAYDGSDHVIAMKAVLPSLAFQETRYIYGVGVADGSELESADLPRAVWYPDPATGQASSAQAEVFTYNRLGQMQTHLDRAGNVHSDAFDAMGRTLFDQVSTLGPGVDSSIREIGYTYDPAGRVATISSYDAANGGNIVNQVLRRYNGLGQLIAEYQAHAGTVDEQTTPAVGYAYSEAAAGANHSRLTSMTYPDGRMVRYEYASGSGSAGVDNSISRLSFLADDDAGNIGTHLEEYTYLGLGTVVARKHPEPGIDLTYIKLPGDPDGEAGDQYTGLDRFGRIVDQRWLDPTTGVAVDRFAYGYDRDSNRVYKQNLVSAANSELYAYDGLNRLIDMQRGTLDSTRTAIVGTPSRAQGWDLDALGNMDGVVTDSVLESRTHNEQNQLTQMGSATLTFDSNGNTIIDQHGKTIRYDAWNRPVEQLNGTTSEITYAYDGLNRRIKEGSTRIYFTAGWQEIEDRTAANVTIAQYTWSAVYIDAMVVRDRDSDANGTLDERLYVLQDANFNVTGIADAAGVMVERYLLDAYGKRTVLDPDWSADADGLSDVAMQHAHQGGKIDPATGRINFRNRETDVDQMRWMREDPKGYGDGMNLYAYLAINPLTHVDPAGYQANPPTGLVGKQVQIGLRLASAGAVVYSKMAACNQCANSEPKGSADASWLAPTAIGIPVYIRQVALIVPYTIWVTWTPVCVRRNCKLYAQVFYKMPGPNGGFGFAFANCR